MRAGMQGIRLSCTVADLHSIRWIIYYKSYWQTPLHEPENGSGRIEFIHKRRTALHKHTDNQQPSAKQHTPLIVMINLLLALGYMAGIYWLSSIPGEANPESTLLSGIVLTDLSTILHGFQFAQTGQHHQSCANLEQGHRCISGHKIQTQYSGKPCPESQ